MGQLKGVMNISAAEWLQALEIPAEEIPDAVVVEGSWWRRQRTEWRLSYLEDSRELAFPDIFWGRWRAKKVAYCCAYGAARSAEIIHLFGLLGARLVVQIGTCGGLQSRLKPGDIVLPEVAICREGVARLYGSPESAGASEIWLEKAERRLKEKGHTVHRGLHLTWPSIFAQDGDMIAGWVKAGYLSVDMETAATYAVARHFGLPSISMLVVWDDLTRGRSFLDPLDEAEQAALNRGNRSVYETALVLIDSLPV